MPITTDALRAKLLTAFPDADLDVHDTTGGGDHFAARVVTAAFAGRGLIDRHRLVYAALGDSMRADIHALTLTTQTPEERRGKTP